VRVGTLKNKRQKEKHKEEEEEKENEGLKPRRQLSSYSPP
jgi:hypothetical protein